MRSSRGGEICFEQADPFGESLHLGQQRASARRRSRPPWLGDLARFDGHAVTHGQSQTGDGESGIMDVYTTFPWATLCEQVLCVKLDLLEGKVIELPQAAAAPSCATAVRGPVGEEAARLTGTRLGTRAANDSESEEKEGGAYRIRTLLS